MARKSDSIPAELIGRHVREWSQRYNGDDHHGFLMLAMRSGLNDSCFYKLCNGSYRYWIRFDTADRVLCAIESPNLWHCDPDLREHYQRVVMAADELRPLEMAA